MSVRTRLCLTWALLGILVPPAPAATQEIGVSVGLAGSDYRELASPLFTGVHASVPIIGWLHARADYRRYTDADETWTRSTCDGLVPPDASCPDDVFEGDFTLSSFGVGLVVEAPLPGPWTGAAGVQRAWSRVQGVWTGRESGERFGRPPHERRAGWSYLASLSYPLHRWIRATVQGRIERPDIEHCITDGYSGFCEQRDVWSVGVGLSLHR